ncbi:membrane integrity-associated transporter subunit PqiC [Aquitalea palustris]|uniref:Membrane integrity-associated transporter subunit PqiC n=1 Tax=Aquitalea palustris TaxID=2480983 RepID=A0A454JGG6_9NEIS|nr:PqiC family protein [Aquitalea palustris]RMC95478.1 membrane integrity-associated transporter subunit PqiC [Aquitalea palustris]
MTRFSSFRQWAHVLPVVVLTTACSTAPVHYYQLQATTPAHAPVQAGTVLLVEAVSLPAEIDRPQLLVENENGQPQLQEQHYWTASLSRLVGQAVAGNLSRQLALSSIYAAPQHTLPRCDLKLYLDIRQFRLQRGVEARLTAAWHLDKTDKNIPLLQGYFDQALPVKSSTHTALVQSQQQLLSVMSEQIGSAMTAHHLMLITATMQDK